LILPPVGELVMMVMIFKRNGCLEEGWLGTAWMVESEAALNSDLE
jgi:hypothetical protein